MNPQVNLFKNESEQTDGGNLNLTEVFRKYIFHWPVFVLSLVVTLFIAFLYLRYTKPVYNISTILLIKDDKTSSSSTDILNQLDMFSNSKVVENEIEILKSKTLMRKVVDRLNLEVNSVSEGRITNSILYEQRPVEFITIETNSKVYGKELSIEFKDINSYILTNTVTGEKMYGKFDSLEKNSIGVFKVVKTSEFNLKRAKPLKLIIRDPSDVVDDYLSRLTVIVAGKNSSIINLSFRSTLLEQGKDVLNTLIQVYNEAALLDKNQTTRSTIKFIDERLGLISGELSEVEQEVESFKSSNGLTDISSEANIYLENVKSNDAQLNEVNLRLGAIKEIELFVTRDSYSENHPSTFGIDDPVLLNQINKLSELYLQRANLLSTTQPDNPVLEPVSRQIAGLKSAILQNIENITLTLERNKEQLKLNNVKFQSSIRKVPSQERRFISIKRQQSIKESLYLYLLQKREEAALSYASAVADSRVVDEAYSSKNPITPKRTLTYLAAIILGFALAVAYLYIKGLFDTTISSLKDITDRTNAPVLGEISLEENSGAIVVTHTSRSAIAEQFRGIRTNLQYIAADLKGKKSKVTLLTSSTSGEGKSFIASNLAVALAISGRKTILLELDLRKPKISAYLSLANEVGLSTYLVGNASYLDIIKPSNLHENLSVIGSGPIPPNPSELLILEPLDNLIEYLRQQFDEIIIDSPPIGLVTDAQIIARVADATIYIVRHKFTLKEQLVNLNKIFTSGKFPRLNVILNGLTSSANYGYGYSYGYYLENKPVKKGFREIVNEIKKRF